MPTKKEHSARKARRCFKLPSYRWWGVGGRRWENLEGCGMEDFQTTRRTPRSFSEAFFRLLRPHRCLHRRIDNFRRRWVRVGPRNMRLVGIRIGGRHIGFKLWHFDTSSANRWVVSMPMIVEQSVNELRG